MKVLANIKLAVWTNLVQSTIFKDVFKDSDTFPMIPLVVFTAISHDHFRVFLYLIFRKRSTTDTVDINKQYCGRNYFNFFF